MQSLLSLESFSAVCMCVCLCASKKKKHTSAPARTIPPGASSKAFVCETNSRIMEVELQRGPLFSRGFASPHRNTARLHRHYKLSQQTQVTARYWGKMLMRERREKKDQMIRNQLEAPSHDCMSPPCMSEDFNESVMFSKWYLSLHRHV